MLHSLIATLKTSGAAQHALTCTYYKRRNGQMFKASVHNTLATASMPHTEQPCYMTACWASLQTNNQLVPDALGKPSELRATQHPCLHVLCEKLLRSAAHCCPERESGLTNQAAGASSTRMRHMQTLHSGHRRLLVFELVDAANGNSTCECSRYPPLGSGRGFAKTTLALMCQAAALSTAAVAAAAGLT